MNETILAEETQKRIDEVVARNVKMEFALVFIKNFLLALERDPKADRTTMEFRRASHEPMHKVIDPLIPAQQRKKGGRS